jgi:hypothetical protein
MSMKPNEIKDEEWEEIFELDKREQIGFCCENMEGIEELKSMAYGVRFDFVSGCPGYVGDVFILLGDGFCAPPVVLHRNYRTNKMELSKL